MAFPLALGLLSFASSAFSAIGQYQAGVAQANAQNRAIANRANQRNRQYELDTARGVSEYNVAKLDAKLQQDEVGMSLSRFVGEEQLANQDAINQYLLADQNAEVQIMERAATDEGGRSRNRGQAAIRSIRRGQGLARANLDRQRLASFRRINDARRSATAQRQALFAQVAYPYAPGPMPSQDVVFEKGPSPLTLIADGVSAVADGALAYKKAQPPG